MISKLFENFRAFEIRFINTY